MIERGNLFKNPDDIFDQEIKIPLNHVKLVCVIFTSVASDKGGEKRDVDPSAGRFVRYQFTPAFLRLRQVGAT